MKKNLMKMSLLFVALVFLWIHVFKVNAAPTNVTISLGINPGTLDCNNSVNGGNLSGTVRTTARNKTWFFTADSWTCIDGKWTGWLVNFQAQTTLLTGNAWVDIPAANVYMMVTGYRTTAGNITWTSPMYNLWTGIASPRAIYVKAVGSGVGTIVSTPNIYVTIPASTPVGAYTGVITVTNAS